MIKAHHQKEGAKLITAGVICVKLPVITIRQKNECYNLSSHGDLAALEVGCEAVFAENQISDLGQLNNCSSMDENMHKFNHHFSFFTKYLVDLEV